MHWSYPGNPKELSARETYSRVGGGREKSWSVAIILETTKS